MSYTEEEKLARYDDLRENAISAQLRAAWAARKAEEIAIDADCPADNQRALALSQVSVAWSTLSTLLTTEADRINKTDYLVRPDGVVRYTADGLQPIEVARPDDTVLAEQLDVLAEEAHEQWTKYQTAQVLADVPESKYWFGRSDILRRAALELRLGNRG